MNRHSRLHSRKSDGTSTKTRTRRISTNKTKSAEPRAEIPVSPVSPVPPSPLPLPLPSLTLPSFPSNSRSYAADGGRPEEQVVQNYTNASAFDILHAPGRGISQQQHFPENVSHFRKDNISGKQFGDAASTTSSSSESGAGDDGSLYATSLDGYCSSSTYPSPPWSTAYLYPADILAVELGDHLTELEAILANDPLHSSMTAECQRKASIADEYVDYERFAQSLEGSLSVSAPVESPFSFQPDEPNRPRSLSLGNPEFTMDYDFSGGAAFDIDNTHPYRPASVRSMTMPTISIPLPDLSTPEIYSNSFSTLSLMPTTGLGLSQPQELYQAYQRRRSVATSNPSYYVPLEQPKFNLFLPWGNSTGLEMREEPALF